MIGALYNGLSGLNTYDKALNTESNNIANVSTIGYKADNISFSDLIYQSSIGKGVRVDNINKNQTQGNLKTTNNPFDIAISGKGYFIVKDNTNNDFKFTRAGNLRMAKDGTLTLPNNYKIQGFPISSSSTLSSDENKIFTSQYKNFLSTEIIKSPDGKIIETTNSKATNYESSAKNDDINDKGNYYKTRASKINDIKSLTAAYRQELDTFATNQVQSVNPRKHNSDITFDMSKINSSQSSIEISLDNNTYTQVFDTDAVTTLKNLADKISAIKMIKASADNNGLLNIQSMLPGEEINITDVKIINGNTTETPRPLMNTTEAISGGGKAKILAIELELKAAIEDADASYLKISNIVDLRDASKKNMSELQLKLDTLNISDDPFGKIEIKDGVIYAKDGDNKFVIGKIATALFTNEYALDPQGDNLYSKSSQSGEYNIDFISSDIISNVLELSNSDLSEGLVNLIVHQRAFEANSKSITTSDDFLKTAIQLKK